MSDEEEVPEVTESDLQELETCLQQAQKNLAVGFQYLRSPVDGSLSGEETASVDTGIGSSDEPCASPLFIGKIPSSSNEMASATGTVQLSANGFGHEKPEAAGLDQSRRLKQSDDREWSTTTGIGFEGSTITLRLITDESALRTLTTGECSSEDDGSAETTQDGILSEELATKLEKSKQEQMLNGRTVAADRQSRTPSREVKAEDFELFIPPPPPLSPSCEQLTNIDDSHQLDNGSATTVCNCVVTEISRNVHVRISDCNMNPIEKEIPLSSGRDAQVIENSDVSCISNGNSVGLCKENVWGLTDTVASAESNPVTGKRKICDEISKAEFRNDNESAKRKQRTDTDAAVSKDEHVERGRIGKLGQHGKKVDRSKLSLNLFRTSRGANDGSSGKRFLPISQNSPKSETTKLNNKDDNVALQCNSDVNSNGVRQSPVASPCGNIPHNVSQLASSPAITKSLLLPENQVRQSPTNVVPEVSSPKSPGTSLLDTMHKKYYAHQYTRDKVQTTKLMCNTELLGNGGAKTAEMDPFEKMLPSSMSDSLISNSGSLPKSSSSSSSFNSIKAVNEAPTRPARSPVASPVADVSIHSVMSKETKQKKSKYSIISLGSFRSKNKVQVIENKYAKVESPPANHDASPPGGVWDACLPIRSSTLPLKLLGKTSKEAVDDRNGIQSLPKSRSAASKLSNRGNEKSGCHWLPTSHSAPEFHPQMYNTLSSRSVCESIPEHSSKEDVQVQDHPVIGLNGEEGDKPGMSKSLERDNVMFQSSAAVDGDEVSGVRRRELRAASLPNQASSEDILICRAQSRSLSIPRVRTDLCLHNLTTTERQQAEIEGVEACRWLRAAGFPQYAQMYEDLQFPIDITTVEKDHDFLDKDSIQSLFRRLNTLNKCASMKIEAPSRKTSDDSEDEEVCALSDKWKYQRSSRRWSRLEIDVQLGGSEQADDSDKKQTMRSCSSNDSVLTDNESFSHTGDESPLLKAKDEFVDLKTSTFVPGSSPEDVFTAVAIQRGISVPSPPHSPTSPSSLRRAASERVKGPSSILKRIENLTSNKRKKKNLRDNVEISGPTLLTDCPEMQLRLQRLGCVDITPTDETPLVSPTLTTTTITTDSGAPSPASTRSSQSEKSTVILNNNNTKIRTPSSSSTEIASPTQESKEEIIAEATTEDFILPSDHKPGTFPNLVSNGYISTGNGSTVNCRTGSINLGSDCNELRDQIRRREKLRSMDDSVIANRVSVYDNVPDLASADDPQKELDLILHGLFEDINGLSRLLNESSGIESDDPCSDELMLQSLGQVSDARPETDSPCNHSEGESRSNNSEADADRLSALSVSSNQEFSDPEVPESKEDPIETVIFRERRDSGVGSSLTREPSERRRPRIRWHSFQKSHRPSFNSRSLQISNVSAGQMVVLKKLCLLKVTALMERYSPSNRGGWNWVVPKFIKKFKSPDYRDKNVFGVPLLVILQRTGQPLPQCILYAMRFLRRTATDAVGIFRKSGVRSRIQKLRNQLETNPDLISFESLQAYDVADLLKQYFRELPECLLTNKLSETFITVHQHIPTELRLEALQAAIMLLPDENREVLQSLLLFLSDMAEHSDENQMTASNLAVCFAPSLFHMCGPRTNQSTASPKRGRKNLGVPDQKELLEQKAAHECLTQMIKDCKQLFMIAEDTMLKCRFSYMEQGDPVSLEELIRDRNGDVIDFNTHIDSWVQGLLKESRDKFKGWVSVNTDDETELAYKKVGDGHPLRLWKCSTDVEAPPVEVLNRILRERHLWDDDLLKWRVVEKLDEQTEVYQYVCNSMAPHPTRDHCELRAWRSDLPKGACVLVTSSIEHPEAPLIGGVRGVVLASRWLIEPCGSGRSRLTHISRVDTRGRSPEWYNKSYGHLAANFVSRISDSFRLSTNIMTEGPETKI